MTRVRAPSLTAPCHLQLAMHPCRHTQVALSVTADGQHSGLDHREEPDKPEKRRCMHDAVDQLQPGSAWTLRNAKIEMYRGCMRLAVDQFGKLEPSDDTSIEPKVTGVNMQGLVICSGL